MQRTQVHDLTSIIGLKNLFELSISGDPINNLLPLRKISTLLKIELYDLKLKKFPKFLLEMPHLLRLVLSGNPIQDLPYEIVEDHRNCLQHARHWFADLEQGKAYNHEVKLILIGNGRVGKSSLLERLTKGKYTPGRKSTHAIQLERWEFPITIQKEEGEEEVDLIINCWDFGGQDIYHATHRLFMQSRALYLVVWDWETEQEKFSTPEEPDAADVLLRNHPLPYWLHYVRTLSKRSPAIIVQNKVDRDRGKPVPNRAELDKLYRIHDLCRVSAETGRGIEDLKEVIVEAFQSMPELGMEMPIAWYRVREKVKEVAATEKDISHERFLELCDEAEVREVSRSSLLRYLHDTGILFYQENLFHNRIILDQQWAINAVYTLFDRDLIYYDYLKRGDGKFTIQNLRKIWKEYTKEECEVFVTFMESCEICFKVNEQGRKEETEYIAPQLLPEEKPHAIKRFWADHAIDSLHLIYENDFLHYAIIQRFIVRAGHLAQEKDIWKYGISFSVIRADALIEVMEWNDKEVIHVQVTGPGRRDILDKIRKEFKEIYYDQASITLYGSLEGEAYVNLEDWEKDRRSGIEEIRAENGAKVSVSQLKEFEEREDGWRPGREEEAKRLRDLRPLAPRESKPLQFFVSYAHEDEAHRERLEEELLVLERTGVIKLWTDRDMLAGSDIDEEILLNRLETADVVCLLVSKDFLKSDYCYVREMKRAVERHELGQAKVIPIIIEKVPNYQYLPFANIAALPQDGYDKPLDSWEDKDAVWEHINEGITKLVEELREKK